MNRAVLGIDAAWTPHEPSGVALVAERPEGWVALAVAPSYAEFLSLANGEPVCWSAPHPGGEANAATLVEACRAFLGRDATLSVVAVDMPLSRVEISGRRTADDCISREFGGRGCSAHSPNSARPGPISAELRKQFEQARFPLSTHKRVSPALIEVYPHPALLTLMKTSYRFKYKLSRRAALWPDASPKDRLANVRDALQSIMTTLSRRVQLDAGSLRFASVVPPVRIAQMKAFEDAIDALVSAWAGTTYLEGAGKMFGDSNAGIWVPT
jgi:predicted RNase H-like nuclease